MLWIKQIIMGNKNEEETKKKEDKMGSISLALDI